MALRDGTPEATRKPELINAYEAGYSVGYRHGLADAKVRDARSAQPTRSVVPPRDVSGARGEGSSAGQSGVPD